jgi:hypothetical protein
MTVSDQKDKKIIIWCVLWWFKGWSFYIVKIKQKQREQHLKSNCEIRGYHSNRVETKEM